MVHPTEEEGGPKAHHHAGLIMWQCQILCVFADTVEVHPGCVVQVMRSTGKSRNAPRSLKSPGYFAFPEGCCLNMIL